MTYTKRLVTAFKHALCQFNVGSNNSYKIHNHSQQECIPVGCVPAVH